MRIQSSEPKISSHLPSGSEVFCQMGKFGRNKKKGKETFIDEGESIYTTIVFTGGGAWEKHNLETVASAAIHVESWLPQLEKHPT